MKKYGLRKVISGVLITALCTGMLPAAFAADPDIPEDAVQFNGHSYQVYTDRMHWEDAKQYCEQLGGHLVSITTAEEQEFLESYMQDVTRGVYMIGLHRELDDLQTWVTGETVSYTNWGNNAVDNANGQQVIGVFTTKEASGTSYQGLPYTIYYGEWDDNFDDGFGFICEWDTIRPKREKHIAGQRYSFNGKEYAFFEDGITWEEAEIACENAGGHLVTITSQQEQDFVHSLIQDGSKNAYWIGLTDVQVEGTWQWVTDESANYLNWGSKQPDNNYQNGTEDLVGMSRVNEDWAEAGRWNDFNAAGSGVGLSTFGYLCEWDGLKGSLPIEYTAGKKYTFNGHEYAFFEDGITWTEAEKACEKTGGHLVTITDQKEQDFVYSLIQNGNKTAYWIGLNDVQTEGIWRWVTGESVNYLNWGRTQPDNDNRNGEDFAGITRIKQDWADARYWNDFSEDGSDTGLNNIGYVCEWDNLNGSVPTETKPEPEPQKPASKDTTSFGSHVSEWSAEEMEKAYQMQLIPEKLVGEDLTRQINRAEFAAVAVKTYESLSGVKAIPAVNNPFTDCRDTEVLKAYSIGAVKGISDTQFAPNALLNREQAAAMLTRVFKRVALVGWTLDTDSQFTLPYTKPASFADDADISGWAKDSVYFMAAHKIISGTGGNRFAPKNITSAQEAQGYANATREQALAIAVRMVENLKD